MSWKWPPFASRQDWIRRAIFWKSPCRVISKGLWPQRSPDLTPSDYFLWGYLKGRVCQNKPRTIDAFIANITEEIQTVTADVLARIFQNMARRVQSCLDANGGHFQHMLWCRHISHTTNVLLFKFRCNIFIGGTIIKEMPGSAESGTLCTIIHGVITHTTKFNNKSLSSPPNTTVFLQKVATRFGHNWTSSGYHIRTIFKGS